MRAIELILEIVWMTLNVGDTWTAISDRTLVSVRPIDLNNTSDHPDFCTVREPNNTILRGPLF